ncbi:WAT1-related protein At4g01440-like isoform X2 [Prosopis cineraria]|uniref:WAT1-related protein At4g01440-like isoform X2 n=1 Tax=Prosopis cineraria TaxID=364024 RepID=UPI00240F46BC|nr:WAT1-related protein At4g01440-like isoform X2 [Prosopis cineraria]
MSMMNYCKWKPVALMILVNLALALANLLLKKVLSEGMSFLTIITYRQLVSAFFLSPIAFFYERKSRLEGDINILCLLFLSALVGVTFTQYLFLLGLGYTSATFSCAFLNMVPIFTFIMALPFGIEKVNLRSMSGNAKVLGSLICIGSVLLTGGCLLWSSWFLIQARISKRYPFQYSSTAILSSFGAIQSAILNLIINRKNNNPAAIWILHGKLQILTVLYSGLVGSGLCYVAMSWCVKERGPVFTAAFTPLIQTFVAILELSILHEQIWLGSAAGSGIVIVGMYILLWGKRKEDVEKHVAKTGQANQQDRECQ